MANINPTSVQPKTAMRQFVLIGALALLAAGVFYSIASLYGHKGYATPPGLVFFSYYPSTHHPKFKD